MKHSDDPKYTEYGNDPTVLKKVGVVGFIMGAILCVSLLITDPPKNPINRNAWVLLFLLFIPGITLILAVLPTVLFHIRVYDDRIEHVFLSLYVISSYSMIDFVKVIEGGRPFPLVMYFKRGKIRFFGATPDEIDALVLSLEDHLATKDEIV